MYCTLPVTTGAPAAVGVTLLVITGSRWPMRIFAFSLLRARIRGLARVLVRPFCFIAFNVRLRGLPVMVFELWCRRSDSNRPLAPVPTPAATEVGVNVAEVG